MVSRGYVIFIVLILATALLPAVTLAYSYSLDESRRIVIVAVSQLSNGSYIGVSADLYVRVTCPGSGHVYVETLPLTQIDLQASTRVAALVASSVANTSFYACDFYASVKSDTPIIGGPSASGVTAVAFASALLRLPLNEGVIMTGMILPDGSIGPVGGLKYKLDAAAIRGAKIFLVPYGQTKDVVYRVVSQRIGPSIITRVIPETIDLVSYGAQLNVQVIPVANVFEAIEIFTNGVYKAIPRGTNPSDRLSAIYSTLNEVLYDWIPNLTSEIMKVVNESKTIEDRALSSIRGYSGIYIRGILQSIDSNIDNLQSRAEILARSGKPYAASSLYFQALVYAYQRLYLLKAIADETFISNEISTINSSVYMVIDSVHKYHLKNGMDIARLSITINTLDRAYEALLYINKTLESRYIDTISQYLALASARIYTAKLWFTLLDKYQGFGSSVPRDDLDRMALYISTLSQNIYTYIVAFSSMAQLPEDVSLEAVYRYSLLLKVDNPLDKLALGISSISYMHLALVSLFLQDYNSAIEAVNKTINTSLSLLSTLNMPPIDIPLHIEMIKALESYPQTQLIMLSRLSIVLSIYRVLGIELSQLQPQSSEISKEVETQEKGTQTKTITVTTTITMPPETITVTTTITADTQTNTSNIHVNLSSLALVATIAALFLIAILLVMLKKS
ncbi:MAG: hypothetical protein N3D82_04240 [Ignisphaera sp.]|nr:hypothetical protein [Ignisphaera sp.]MCX8168218.1 hypothetical protein [Ignisphaera sp.]MDW8084912.1 S16 family serine protease [Ignisphaera sp.]